MSPQASGLIVGGVIPALLYGIAGIFAKGSTNAGLGVGPFIMLEGASLVVVGGWFYFLAPAGTLSVQSGMHATLAGLSLGLGAGLTVFALIRFAAPISQISSLAATFPMVTVALGLWIFSEWKEVDVSRLLLGAVLIVVGGIIVSRA
jgi:hypothetical protein